MKRDPSVYKFIKSISAVTLDKDRSAYIRHYVKKGGPWYYIYNTAQSERVSELLFYHLQRMCLLNGLPAPIINKLENSYKATLGNNLNYMACLFNIEEVLNINNINAIVLQGLSVLKLYGDPGLRSMSDMDILVKPEHMEVTLDSLKQTGFQVLFPDKPDLLFKDNVLLDIHTHPLNIDRVKARKNIFPEDITGFWERASYFSEKGETLLRMDMHDSFLCLSAHALKHCFGKLIWFCDLHKLLLEILKNKDGWRTLIERAEAYRQKRGLVYSLMLLEQVYEIYVPLKVKKKLDFNRINIIEKRIICLISKGAKFETVYVILWLFSIKGIRGKIRFLKETVFLNRGTMASTIKKRPTKIRVLDYCNRVFYIIRTIGRDISRILAVQ